MLKKIVHNPTPMGNLLPKDEIEKVSKTLYNRFQYVYGLRPSWGDNKRVDEACRTQVKSVLDSLEINGYKLVKIN